MNALTAAQRRYDDMEPEGDGRAEAVDSFVIEMANGWAQQFVYHGRPIPGLKLNRGEMLTCGFAYLDPEKVFIPAGLRSRDSDGTLIERDGLVRVDLETLTEALTINRIERKGCTGIVALIEHAAIYSVEQEIWSNADAVYDAFWEEYK